MNHTQNKLINHLQLLADKAGKELLLKPKRGGLSLTCHGRGIKVPTRISEVNGFRHFEKKLGLGSN